MIKIQTIMPFLKYKNLDLILYKTKKIKISL